MMRKGVGGNVKRIFVGDMHIPDKYTPGVLRNHEYSTFRVAPSTNNQNEHIDTLIKSFHSIKNNQMFKNLRGGQPVIALEQYAEHGRSFYMYSVPKKNKLLFKDKLESTFEGGGVKEYDHSNKWPFNVVEKDKNTLVAYLSLSKSAFFPIQMRDDVKICRDLLHVTEELKEGEKSFVQILLEPVDEGWQSELERAYEQYLMGNESEASGGFLKSGGRMLDSKLNELTKSLGEKGEDRRVRKHREIKELRDKMRQSAFNVVVRVCIKASSYERRNDIVEGIAGAFKSSNFYNAWQLSPAIRKQSTLSSIRNRQAPIIGTSNLLCDDEVKALLRFPTKEEETKWLERMNPNEEKIDERVTKNIIPVGSSIEFDEEGSPVGFNVDDDDAASKARLWIAPPGSGKSTMVKKFMQGAMEVGHGGSIFDVADGRLYYEAIEATPPSRREKLVLVDFANTKYPHIFNFSSLGRDADDIGAMFSEFFQVFFKTANNHRMNSFLRKSAMTTFMNPDHTFLELIKMMRDEDFRRKILPTIRKENPDLFLWWKTEFPKFSDTQINEILQPILYRLDEMQMNKRLGPIFCGRGGKLEIYKWMNNANWVFYNLSNGVFLETEQRMMMSFLNYAYWTATLSREHLLKKKMPTPIHHKMYDEPQTYMTATPIFQLSISKSRKYRVSDNFLIQNPSQVIRQDESLWQEIIGMNPNIVVGGGLDPKSLKEMAFIMGLPIEELKRLESLEYHWYFKTYVGKEAIKPFVFDASGMPSTYGFDKELELKWRRYFAPQPYDAVRKEISARNLNLTLEEYDKLLLSYDEVDDDDEEGVPLGKD